MEKTLWDIVEESKAGKVFLKSEQQYKNLDKVLAKMDQKNVEKVQRKWQDIVGEFYDSEDFYKLHTNDGGIISGGDDAFYMDFANWVVAQGEELYNKFEKKGHEAILDYIEEYNIKEEDYMFECMSYAFHPYID